MTRYTICDTIVIAQNKVVHLAVRDPLFIFGLVLFCCIHWVFLCLSASLKKTPCLSWASCSAMFDLPSSVATDFFFLSLFFPFFRLQLNLGLGGGSAEFLEWCLFVLHCRQRPHYSLGLLVLFCVWALLLTLLLYCVLCVCMCVIWRQLCSWVPSLAAVISRRRRLRRRCIPNVKVIKRQNREPPISTFSFFFLVNTTCCLSTFCCPNFRLFLTRGHFPSK